MMITISDTLLGEIQIYGEQTYPEEGAGVLLGHVEDDNRNIVQILPFANQFEADLRSRRYLITPQDMIKAEEFADSLGLEILGIFHSHPDHPARPSEFDRERALPWYSYLITSVREKSARETRSWRLTDARAFIEEEVMIEKNSRLEEA